MPHSFTRLLTPQRWREEEEEVEEEEEEEEEEEVEEDRNTDITPLAQDTGPSVSTGKLSFITV